MKHMAIMGLMLAFTLPAVPAETGLAEERQEKEARWRREHQKALDAFIAEFAAEERQERERQEREDAIVDAQRGVTPGTTARERLEREERERLEREERERQARVAAVRERQARIEAERERKERTDALPPKARLAAELCHDADAVMGMAVRASRVDLSDRGHISSYSEILHVIKTDRRYLPAAPEETALKLSRLARNLRKEAELWGFPCD